MSYLLIKKLLKQIYALAFGFTIFTAYGITDISLSEKAKASFRDLSPQPGCFIETLYGLFSYIEQDPSRVRKVNERLKSMGSQFLIETLMSLFAVNGNHFRCNTPEIQHLRCKLCLNPLTWPFPSFYLDELFYERNLLLKGEPSVAIYLAWVHEITQIVLNTFGHRNDILYYEEFYDLYGNGCGGGWGTLWVKFNPNLPKEEKIRLLECDMISAKDTQRKICFPLLGGYYTCALLREILPGYQY